MNFEEPDSENLNGEELKKQTNEIVRMVLGQAEMEPMEEGFREEPADLVYRFLKEAELLHGSKFAHELADRVYLELAHRGAETDTDAAIKAVEDFKERSG